MAGSTRLAVILLLIGCWVCACAEECTTTCFLVYIACAKSGSPVTDEACRNDLWRCTRDCGGTETDTEQPGVLIPELEDELSNKGHGALPDFDAAAEEAEDLVIPGSVTKRGSWSKRRHTVEGGNKHRLARVQFENEQGPDSPLPDKDYDKAAFSLPMLLAISKFPWADRAQEAFLHRAAANSRQPIDFKKRGSWSKRQPIGISERGSWSKRDPIRVAERGSWSKRQPIEIDERGSWSKRGPISVEGRGSWNKRQPIHVEERGSWSKRQPSNFEQRES